jgi:hypothetical protein
VLLAGNVTKHWRALGDDGRAAAQTHVLAALGASENPAELR